MNFQFTLVLSNLITLATVIQCDIVVETTSGQLRGYEERYGLYQKFYSFKGIPYAEPPVGELRFRAPKPHRGWSGIRHAFKHGHHCPSNGFLVFLKGGDEDCLFLNIYTPNLENTKRAVMVWVHGGAYLLSDGNALVYGAGPLMKEDVVLVTLNYRLGALGFFSTEDQHAPGNYALKDVILALKFVKANIEKFGGDPKRITLAGQSAGACTVSNLLFSRAADDLFHQAIMMSGNALMPSLYQENPKKKAEEIASRLKIYTNSTAELVEKMRGVHFKDILKHEKDLFNQDNPLGLRNFDFAPSVEPKDSEEERILTDSPINLLLQGKFRSVPMMIGTTNKEGLFNVRQLLLEPSVVEKYNENPDYFVPLSFEVFNDTNEVEKVAKKMREIYFRGENMTLGMEDEFAIFQTHAGFQFPADRLIKLLAQKSDHEIFYYQFSFDGALNFIKTFLFEKGFDGAAHADDVFYLFKPSFPELVFPNNIAFQIRRRHARMWANFIQNGNPTPETDELIKTIWPRYTLEGEEYLDIGEDMEVKNGFEQLKIFHDLQMKYTGHL